ncbi:transglutaminase domain-containing protein [bacterium]|nr:transglutaminase domain-containing protein [bacterium]
MRFPPLFIGFSTIFWGFCAGWEVFSIVAAVIFEAHNLIKTRFDLQKKDFVRISDLSSLVMFILLFYSYVENEPRMIFLGFITTLPIIFMPLLFAQLFSTSDKVVIGTKFGKRIHAHAPVDIRTLYILSILFATAAANIKSVWFIALFMLIIFVVLSGTVKDLKSFKRYLKFCFVAVFITVLIGATVVGGHFLISRKMMQWYNDWYESLSADPFRTSTSMGEIGKMKLSGEIVFRVYPDEPSIPLYMKQSDYNVVVNNTWYSRPKKTDSIFPDSDMEWQFFGTGEGKKRMKISIWMNKNKGEGVLPLPNGAKRALELDVAGIERSILGAIYVEEGPELLEFIITYDPEESFEPMPRRSDLFVPKEEQAVIDEVMRQNGLIGATHEETLENIERFFAGFNYTLDLKNRAERGSYLADFLNNTREGHCEYFATATVLMLRSAGIAARYRTGYMLDEYDTFENALLARKRDAHAWVTAYIGERWIDVDTTPPQWKSADSDGKSFFEPVSDFMSWIKMKYENYRRKKSSEFNRILIAAASLLTIFLMLRVYLRKRRVKKAESDEIKPLFEAAGLDSPLYKMLDYYAENGMTREESETLRRWIEKNREKLGGNIDFSALVRLHEELRFDTGGDKAALMAELVKEYEEWKKSKES